MYKTAFYIVFFFLFHGIGFIVIFCVSGENEWEK